MRRSIRQRVLLVALLFCKLVTAQFALEPMAMAADGSLTAEASMIVGASVRSEASTAAHPCPAHAVAQDRVMPGTQSSGSKDHGSCQSACCKCPCAHTPALAVSAMIPSPRPAVQSAPALYAAPSPPGSDTPFFRPPIQSIV